MLFYSMNHSLIILTTKTHKTQHHQLSDVWGWGM